MANITYDGAGYTNPLRVLPSGVMKLESTTDYSLPYRVMTSDSPGTSNGLADGALNLEWRPDGDLAGGRFGVFLADNNGANKVYLGEMEYGRRSPVIGTFSDATTLTSAKTKNRCQMNSFTVPVASCLIFDGAATVRLYIVPRDNIGCIVTAAEFRFPD